MLRVGPAGHGGAGQRPSCSAGDSRDRDLGALLLRSVRTCFLRCFPQTLRSVISQPSLSFQSPPSIKCKCLIRLPECSLPAPRFLRWGNQGQKLSRATPELQGGVERRLSPGTLSVPRVGLVSLLMWPHAQRSFSLGR